MSQTQRVRMNLRPGSLPRSFLLHSSSSGSFDPWPAIGLRTTASLKWSITAAMANAPPSRSYKLGSVISNLLDRSIFSRSLLELLLRIDSDEGRGEREVGGAVNKRVAVKDDRRRRGRRALLAHRPRPVDRGPDRSGPGPAGVDRNRAQHAPV